MAYFSMRTLDKYTKIVACEIILISRSPNSSYFLSALKYT